jgi:hypothetical protein
MPTSVLTAVIALGIMLTSEFVLAVFVLLREPEAEFRPFIGLLIGGLVLWGLIVGHRLAWQWGRILGVIAAVLLTASLALGMTLTAEKGTGNEPGWSLAVKVVLLAVMAGYLWTIYFALGRASALEHFQLRCPKCNQITRQAADFFFNRAKCKSCQHVWS